MPALFVFLLKVNLALTVFCLGYYLVLRKLTFYTLNRFYLVLAVIFSSVYPLINVNDFIARHQSTARLEQVVLQLKAPAEKLLIYPWYWNWATAIFWIGAAVFAMRLLVQFISLYRIYRRSAPGTLKHYDVRVTDANISPFSFWRSVFINPTNIEAADLENILQHEYIHASQWHTLDILLAEVSVVFYWFNPGVWFIKKAVTENLEFITDRQILQQGADSKAYQYSLLNVGMNVNTSPNITNHFNFSTLKKRIWMMNARRSSTINLSRYALLVPSVVICLCICSISKASVVDNSKAIYSNIESSIKEIAGGSIAEVVIKSKRIAHKLTLNVAGTTPKTKKPIVIYLSPAVDTPHTFKAQMDFTLKTDTNAKGETATKPHTFKSQVSFSYTIKDDTGKKGETSISAPVEKAIVLKPDTGSRVIKAIRINGKNIAPEDLKKMPAGTIQEIRIDDNSSDTSKSKLIKVKTKNQ